MKNFLFALLLGMGTLYASKLDPLDLDIERAENAKIKDRIVVHGMVLYGKVIDIGQDKLSFKLLYSTGISLFAYKDIDAISTRSISKYGKARIFVLSKSKI